MRMTGVSSASESAADITDVHGIVVDDIGVHGQVHARRPQ